MAEQHPELNGNRDPELSSNRLVRAAQKSGAHVGIFALKLALPTAKDSIVKRTIRKAVSHLLYSYANPASPENMEKHRLYENQHDNGSRLLAGRAVMGASALIAIAGITVAGIDILSKEEVSETKATIETDNPAGNDGELDWLIEPLLDAFIYAPDEVVPIPAGPTSIPKPASCESVEAMHFLPEGTSLCK